MRNAWRYESKLGKSCSSSNMATVLCQELYFGCFISVLAKERTEAPKKYPEFHDPEMCKQAIDECNAHMAYMLAQEGSLDRTRQKITENRQSRARESVHQNSSPFREAWKVLQHQIDLDLKALEASVILNKAHDLHRFMARRRMRQMKMAHQETLRNLVGFFGSKRSRHLLSLAVWYISH